MAVVSAILSLVWGILLSAFVASPLVYASQTDALTAISSAQNTLSTCYESAKAAEAAGANISALQSSFSAAGSLISQANLAYSTGDFDSAANFAMQSQRALDKFESEASSLKSVAIHQVNLNFLINVVGSIVGCLGVLVGGFVIWHFLGKKYTDRDGNSKLVKHNALFIVIITVLALFVASPAIQHYLVYPERESYTELWLLGSGHTAQGYPYNIVQDQNYSVFVGVENHLGFCGYYLIEVKFRNETQSSADSLNGTPSSLPSLYNLTAFVPNKQTLEIPVTFALSYTSGSYNETLPQVVFQQLTFSNQTLGLNGCFAAWNAQTHEFAGYLSFELWLYDDVIKDFWYNSRVLNLHLNMTLPS
jgi:hypothetical protein